MSMLRLPGNTLCVVVLIAVILLLGPIHAQEIAQGPATSRPPATRCVLIELFVDSDSATSQAAREFLETLSRERPGVRCDYRNIGSDRAAAARLELLRSHYRVPARLLPVIHLSGQLTSGWIDEAATGERIKRLLTVQVFVREGCPRCANAKIYLNRIAPRYPGLRFEFREVLRDPSAVRDFQALCQRHAVQAPSFPGIHVGDQLIVGFLSEGTTGRRIDAALDAITVPCSAAATQEGQGSLSMDRRQTLSWAAFCAPFALVGGVPAASPNCEQPVEESIPDGGVIEVPWFGRLCVRELGLPAVTLLVGLVDGFNPCAMWVLLILLSVLVNLKDRRKILAIAGTFVAVSGMAYYAFMAAWLNVFMLIGLARPAQLLLGALAIGIGAIHIKDFFAFRQGISLSIPDAAKPRIMERIRRIVAARTLGIALASAFILAVLVNIVELLCTAGLPALYTEILTLQQLPSWQNYSYLALYNVAYMFDDCLMVAAVTATLSKTRLQERGGRWLKLISGVAILLLGLVMLCKPEWLV